MRILLVEDDAMIGEATCVALEDAAYAVEDWVGDGATDVLQDGGHQPVLVITARDGVDERIEGLDFSADDNPARPFDVNQLLARLRAIVRRPGGHAAPVLGDGKVSLDPGPRRRVLRRCGGNTQRA